MGSEAEQDDEWKRSHYKNGFRKFSCFPVDAYIRLGISCVSFIVSVIALLLTR